MSRVIYGVPTQTLEEVVLEFMLQQGNVRRNHEAEYMVTAQEVYYDLFRTTLWEMNYMVLEVDKDTNTVQLPCGSERVIGLSVIDVNGLLRPLGYDRNMNTLQVRCHKETCSCSTCNGDGTLCEAIDSISFRTEPINIDGVDYFKRIWNKKEGAMLIEVREVPVKENGEVSYITQRDIICEFDVDENDCIKPTPANEELIKVNCGCYITSSPDDMYTMYDCADGELPASPNGFGHWKQDAICDKTLHLRNVEADKIILSYQADPTDGNPQLLLPRYAKDAFKFGMSYQTVAFKPRVSSRDKEYAESKYLQAKKKLFYFMHPINLNRFMRITSRKQQFDG